MKLLDAFKAAFDSLVRTYSPMLVTLVVGWLAIVLQVPVPEEVKAFVILLVSVLFGALWYGILRIIEIIRGKASKLLGLGLVKSKPAYDLTQVTLENGEKSFLTRAEYAEWRAMFGDELKS